MICTSWPNDGGWQCSGCSSCTISFLDSTMTDASQCQALCIDQGEGCCMIGYYGCTWWSDSEAEIVLNSSNYFAVTCLSGGRLLKVLEKYVMAQFKFFIT